MLRWLEFLWLQTEVLAGQGEKSHFSLLNYKLFVKLIISTQSVMSYWLSTRPTTIEMVRLEICLGQGVPGPAGGLKGRKGEHMPEDPAVLWSPDCLFITGKPVLHQYGLRASASASTCSTPSWTYVDEESDRIVKFMSWTTVLVSATKMPELGKLPMLQQ